MARLKGKARDRARKKQKNKDNNSYFHRKKNLIGEIRKYDDPILEVECSDFSKEEWMHQFDAIKDIFKKMKQVLNATKNGVGLAAPQIGITKNMIIIKPDSDSSKITCMINPEIVSTSGNKKFGREMCLSYPQAIGMVERYTSVKISYYDQDWKKHIVEYKEGNILGIVCQHELSHLSEGHCEIYDWWKDPEGMQKELEDRFKPSEEKTSNNEVVESEDFKREKEEKAVEVTKEALKKDEFVEMIEAEKEENKL